MRNISVELCVCVQGEMQKLKDKLAVSERTAKAESQLKVVAYIVNILLVKSVVSNASKQYRRG